jgi:hypothetical protein
MCIGMALMSQLEGSDFSVSNGANFGKIASVVTDICPKEWH